MHITVDLLTKSLSPTSSSLTNTSSDIEVLERSVQTVSDMLNRVLTYVRSVIAGETKGDPAIGRYLLETFATSTEGLDQGSFASSLQVRPSLHYALTHTYISSLITAGYTHDFLPREPHQVSSRSLFSPPTRRLIVPGVHRLSRRHCILPC